MNRTTWVLLGVGKLNLGKGCKMYMHTWIRKPNKDDHNWWICEIGIRKYKFTHTTYWYFSFLFWVLCVEIRKKGW